MLGKQGAIRWYGHSCVQISVGGRTALIDPWFGNPLSPESADNVAACDLLLVTHSHSDHVGESVAIAKRLRPAWPAVPELALWLETQCGDAFDRVLPMNTGGTLETDYFRITMTKADHSAGEWASALQVPMYLGEPAGFVVEATNGLRVYHAGDTDVFGDMRLIRRLYKPDLALLPIGGRFTMGPREAALAVELLEVEHVIPIHYGTIPAIGRTPEEFRNELGHLGLGSVAVHVLRPGEELK